MMLLMLGVLDIAIGTALAAQGSLAASILLALGILAVIKGAFSVLNNIVTGFWLDVLGFLDLLAGISLIMGWSVPFLWIIVIVKGLWSVIMGVASK